MGQVHSKQLIEELFSLNALDFPYGLWSYEKPKNFDFYFTNKRCIKISRKLYPQYKRGYLYGYWEDLDYWDKLAQEEFAMDLYREF